ncbi:MAG: hypothetical protein WA432_04580 [Candidatus Babeliaceae bacterium]
MKYFTLLFSLLCIGFPIFSMQKANNIELTKKIIKTYIEACEQKNKALNEDGSCGLVWLPNRVCMEPKTTPSNGTFVLETQIYGTKDEFANPQKKHTSPRKRYH